MEPGPVFFPTTVNCATPITPPAATMSPLEKLEARVIKSHHTAEYLHSLKPHTPVNIALLRELLHSYPNHDFVSNLCFGLTNGFRVGYQGRHLPRNAPNLPSANAHPHVIEENLLMRFNWVV